MQDTGRNLTHQLTHQLGAAIVQGRYAIDKPFPTEAELSTEFNISRSVTREAVKMLTAKGLIASRPRQGIRVMPNSHWNMFDAAAQNHQDQQAMDAIGHALERMKAAEEGKEDSLAADIAFHCAILAASNNRFFYQLREFIQVALRVSIASTNQLKGVLTADYGDHKRIYDAIIKGDAEAANQAVKNLLAEVMQLIFLWIKPR